LSWRGKNPREGGVRGAEGRYRGSWGGALVSAPFAPPNHHLRATPLSPPGAIIFIDEIDAVGTKRGGDDGDGGNREVHRTMLELLSQLDGFSSNDKIKVIAATNRPETLDPALLRSGRLDRKIELPHPDENSRVRILQIHSRKMACDPADVNFEELARATDDFNGAMLKAVCVEAGMIAMRRDAVTIRHEDFVEGIQAVQSKKKAALRYYA